MGLDAISIGFCPIMKQVQPLALVDEAISSRREYFLIEGNARASKITSAHPKDGANAHNF